jgi:hypothetical protein
MLRLDRLAYLVQKLEIPLPGHAGCGHIGADMCNRNEPGTGFEHKRTRDSGFCHHQVITPLAHDLESIEFEDPH